MNRILALVLFAASGLLLTLAPGARAADPGCERMVLAGSQEELYRQVFANWETNAADALGPRGFLGDAIPQSPESTKVAREFGLTWWGIRFFLVPDLETALAHRRKIHEHYVTIHSLPTENNTEAMYILGTEEELGLKFDEAGPGQHRQSVPAAKIGELLARGSYTVDLEGRARYFTPEHMRRRLSLNDWKYNNTASLPTSAGRNSITLSGWVTFGDHHGIHDHEAWLKTSSGKEMLKMARKLADRGFTVRFDHDYEAAMSQLARQVRTYRDTDGDGKRKEGRADQNRYDRTRPEGRQAYDTMLAMLKAGEGYSVEVYDPAGRLVAGEVGVREGNEFIGDSVFYDEKYLQETYGIRGVDAASYGTVTLFAALLAHGIRYSDPEMVTGYTLRLGGQQVPYAEYRRMMHDAPEEFVKTPPAWEIRSEEYRDAAFQQLARDKSKGLTRRAFVGRLPFADAESIARAAKFGVARGELEVVPVGTLDEARFMASQLATPEDIPLYVIVPEGDEGLTIPQLVSREGGVRVVTFNHPRFVSDAREVDYRRLAEFFKPAPAEYATYGDGRIRIPAWYVPTPKK